MVNYLQLGQSLAKHLPMTEGCTSTVKLGKKGIEALVKKNPELEKVITELTEGVTNPILEIAQKAQNNYAIASFKIKSSETVLGKGAYSTSTGTKGTIEKMHVEKDNIITTISKEGNAEAVVKELSKSDLAKAIQKRANASEYMTKETSGLKGEKILTRSLKNGKKIETQIRKDGSTRTKITMPDGRWYVREKSYETYELPDKAKTELMERYNNTYLFKGIKKNVRIINEANQLEGGKKMADSGVIYGIDISSKNYRPIVRYKGKGTTEYNQGYEIQLENPRKLGEFVNKILGRNDNILTGEKVNHPGLNGIDMTEMTRKEFLDIIGK